MNGPLRNRILIAEDEAIVREDLRDTLVSVGYDVVGTVMSGPDAVAAAGELRPDLVLMDIRLRGSMDGIEAACEIGRRYGLPVVFLTAFADDATIQRAKHAEPYGYLTKPLQERALRAAIEVALHRRYPPQEIGRLPGVPAHGESLDEMIGAGPAIEGLRAEIGRLAPVDMTVIIEGETGTGKELAARAIHRTSRRAAGPFLAVNCAALTESLASTELFGHRKGAFTGAQNDHKGVFESAAGGTVFLDEIGDIPKAQQPYLLRVLEERAITRVGESVSRPIDVRVVAATNRRLEEEVAAGRFRADLFYRIRVGRIQIPPLRQRIEDIPALANAFLMAFGRRLGRAFQEIGSEAMEIVTEYPWPGNVRELRNAIEFAALRSLGESILPTDLPPELQALSPSVDQFPPAMDEREALRRAIDLAGGNRTEAARRLGISRATLYRRLTELGLESVP